MTDEAPVKMPRMSGSDVERVDPTTTRVLTEVVNRLRRTLRTSIRADYPWETLPMAKVELRPASFTAVRTPRTGGPPSSP